VEFEANVADSGRDVKFTFPVDPKFAVSIKQSATDGTTLGLAYVLDQNLTIKCDVVNPALVPVLPKTTLTGEYVTESFSVETKLETAKKSFKVGFASDIPAGPSGSRFGLLYTGMYPKDKVVLTHEVEAKLGLQQSDYEVALSANFKDLTATPAPVASNISSGFFGLFSVNANTSVFTKIALDQNEINRSHSLGLAYSFNASTTAKLKCSMSNVSSKDKDGKDVITEQRMVDLAITNAFDGKNQATCAVQFKNGEAPKFGVYVTLE